MIKFYDPAIPRKSNNVQQSLEYRNGTPKPSLVEVSNSGTCNRSCGFCPRSDPSYPDDKSFISTAMVEKLARDLVEIEYHGVVLFSGFVEPLLDKSIYDHLRILRGALPRARLEVVTNGDALNEGRIGELFNSGLSTLLISVYDGAEEALAFESMCLASGLRQDQFVIRHRYFDEGLSFGITINNRAGMMLNAKFPIAQRSEPSSNPCYYPHYSFFMDYKGDVLLCPHDWGKKRIVGNIVSSSLWDIWIGPEFTKARGRLALGDRKFSPCALCDVEGTLIGGAHAKAWATLEQI